MRITPTLLIVLAVSLLVGCSLSSEHWTSSSVVIDGTLELKGEGWRNGKDGFMVNAYPVIKALGGKVETLDRTKVMILVNDKRIVVGKGEVSKGVAHDAHLSAPIGYFDDKLQLYGGVLEDLLPLAFPGGGAYRKGDRIIIRTGP